MLTSVFDLIDMRSFGALWYWIVVAVSWSMASHWVLGVPYDMVLRARRRGGASAEDLRLMAGVAVRRLLGFWRDSGVGLTAAASCALTLLLVLGFGHGVEFAQALSFIVGPMMVVMALGLWRAVGLERALAAGMTADDLIVALSRHRFMVQAIGGFSVMITALWGMAHLIRPYL
ncbi:MAG TPA: component of SufBCD complex [Paenirhodobacter sp.]